ncbi:hypothetical protein LZ30DRAFT_212356 [Colletotrichum cereale]|nr:hypothetical protein LZ30DRAFT_212356 [Colletotrichum cereale]
MRWLWLLRLFQGPCIFCSVPCVVSFCAQARHGYIVYHLCATSLGWFLPARGARVLDIVKGRVQEGIVILVPTSAFLHAVLLRSGRPCEGAPLETYCTLMCTSLRWRDGLDSKRRHPCQPIYPLY